MAAVKFQKFYVSTIDPETKQEIKEKVWYSLDNRVDGRKAVTVYSWNYGYNLGKILPENYTNNTDFQTDYFDKGKSVIFEGDEHYAAARARAEQNEADRAAKLAAPKKVHSFELKEAGEFLWTTEVRGIAYSIKYRFKPGYLMWLVTSESPRSRKAKWVRTPKDIAGFFPYLRGIETMLPDLPLKAEVKEPVEALPLPPNCVMFPTAR